MSEYFTYPPLTAATVARAADVNSRFMGVSTGFDKLPPPAYIAEDRVTFSVDVGVANAYVVNPILPISAYTLGLRLSVQATNPNSGPSTINVSGLGVKQIIRSDSTALEHGDIVAGQMLTMVYDGFAFQLAMAFAEISPSGIKDLIEAAGDIDINGDLTVNDEPYGPDWNASLQVPTKNATYDEMENRLKVANDPWGDNPQIYKMFEGNAFAVGNYLTEGSARFYKGGGSGGYSWGPAMEMDQRYHGAGDTGGGFWVDIPPDDIAGVVHFQRYGRVAGYLFDDTVKVPDEAYGPGWNSKLDVPTKNAVYDQMETRLAFKMGSAFDATFADVHDYHGITISDGSGNATTGSGRGIISFGQGGTGNPTDTGYIEFDQPGWAGGAFIGGTAHGRLTFGQWGGITGFEFAAQPYVGTNKIYHEGFPPPAGGGTVSDTAYGPTWDGDTGIAPSKNAVYDKVQTLVPLSSVGAANGVASLDSGGKVPAAQLPAVASQVDDTVYGPSWDGVLTTAPSKNAVYDKIQSLGVAGVSSFNSRTGVVTLTSGDVTTALTFTPANAVHTHAAADIVSGTLAAARMPALTGDVTTAVGTVNTTLTDAAVTYAKIQAAGANTVLCRASGSGGPVGELLVGASTLVGRGSTGNLAACTLGASLGFAGSVLSVLSVPNLLTFNASNAGDVAGSTYNGGAAVVVSANTVGALPLTPRQQSVGSAATVTPTFLNDIVIITAQAVGLTLANWSGTAVANQGMVIRIKDSGTSQTIAYGTQYRAIGLTAPVATVPNKTLYLGCIWNATDSKIDIVSVAQE